MSTFVSLEPTFPDGEDDRHYLDVAWSVIGDYVRVGSISPGATISVYLTPEAARKMAATLVEAADKTEAPG